MWLSATNVMKKSKKGYFIYFFARIIFEFWPFLFYSDTLWIDTLRSWMDLHFFHSTIFLHSFNLKGYVVVCVDFVYKKDTKLHFQILIESWFVACCHTKLIQNVNLVNIFEVKKVNGLCIGLYVSLMYFSHFCHFSSYSFFVKKVIKWHVAKYCGKYC